MGGPKQITLWELFEQHKDLKKHVKRLQTDVRIFSRIADVEKKKRYMAEKEKAIFQKALQGGINRAKQDYKKLRPRLDIVKERCYQILLSKAGLTYKEIEEAYESRYHHFAETNPRLRELFAEGRAIKVQDPKRRIHWFPKPKLEDLE